MLRLSAASLCLLAKRSMSVVVDEACAPRLRLALVRHGESMNNVHEAVSEAAYVANRHADPDLSPRGYRQADALGGFLANASRSKFLGVHPVDEVWVSPHRRTLLTVAPFAAASGHRPRVNTKLFEAGGVYDANDAYDAFAARGGLTRSEMAARHPTYALPDEVTEDGWYAPPTPGSGKETDDECRDRALGVAADVHYDFICAFLDALVAPATRGPFLRWRHWNTAITVVDVDGATGAASFVAQNAVAHLLDERDPALLSGFPL
ncbi:hypothetical protein SO694_00015411 [Aureococcus anophagefferens]|uniref:Phosphoglycerate mutase (2,3-diphosphoglycerate-dependent) n=1 Tax=Aureococcus anophagefferens TaxID=44056 RepID=A0ABR1G3M8_AURAN